MYVYIYIYIYRERDRERERYRYTERERETYNYIYIYIYVGVYGVYGGITGYILGILFVALLSQRTCQPFTSHTLLGIQGYTAEDGCTY